MSVFTISLRQTFHESSRLYYLRNIFTAFAVALSDEAKFQKSLESFLSLPSIFGYLGKGTKNTAEHVILFTHGRA